MKRANISANSSCAPAPNYAEARGAESKADFIHKLGIVRKELNESRIWLRILHKTGAPASELVAPLLGEVTELSRIIESSLKTARSHH
ncbi:four helix bundle protein [Ruficoccus amylovorans]|uniref:Four helix bundle protein n=1 Tax=Ruficoccus amylovorans TaxID=1804625 RepID=A0A842HJK1_9BACT|nr:four helix bundle protein [Ruficoccus amylovorans]MBC2596300.1 four helix bundle protein [Ruficoccus amylovorans]